MKILIVKKKDSCWPFVEEQVQALLSQNAGNEDGIDISWHLIEGNGARAYLQDIAKLIRDIHSVNPDIIHAHYGLSGYYACLVVRMIGKIRKIPIVITYHGSDINSPKVHKLSQRAIRMADYNIFVSPRMVEQVEVGENSEVIPCGLNMEEWPVVEKAEARKRMKMDSKQKYVLFSSDFHTEVKNPALAKQAINVLTNKGVNAELIELDGYTRSEVNLLMRGADVCLMTSFTEGSPQFIKEAMVCGCPIVTTDVGDVRYVIGETGGCFFTSYNVEDCAMKIQSALAYAKEYNRTCGRRRIENLGLNNEIIAQKIRDIYNHLTKK